LSVVSDRRADAAYVCLIFVYSATDAIFVVGEAKSSYGKEDLLQQERARRGA